MNRLKYMLIAILGMVAAACSNDDMPSDSELDKFDQIESPEVIGLNNVGRLLKIFPDGTPCYTHEPLEGSIQDGDYSISIIHNASEFEEADINGRNLPVISFNTDFSESELEKYWMNRYGDGTKTIYLNEKFPDIDWSSQSLVFITRQYSSTGMELNQVKGKVYRKDGGFVITLQNVMIFDIDFGLTLTHCGFAVLVDKPNIQAKDLKIRMDNTDYYWQSKEKKAYSKWLKL